MEQGGKVKRKSSVKRDTNETKISLSLNIDGSGKYEIDTGIPFFDHMLNLFSKHGLFDIKLKTKGDTCVDFHHTVEDTGIVMGKAFKEALGDFSGIKRYGCFSAPMDETLVDTAIDISGRPFLVFKVKMPKEKAGDFDSELVESFFKAFSDNLGCNLHINLRYGENLHHIIEAVFKSFAKAMDTATFVEARHSGILSTKGIL